MLLDAGFLAVGRAHVSFNFERVWVKGHAYCLGIIGDGSCGFQHFPLESQCRRSRLDSLVTVSQRLYLLASRCKSRPWNHEALVISIVVEFRSLRPLLGPWRSEFTETHFTA